MAKLFFLFVAGLLVLLHIPPLASSAFQFRVGGENGWTNPAGGNVFESYNHWARRTRFHIGDSVYFKYADGDSVLVVDREGYSECNATSPLLKFTNGSTTFQFDRYGFFYFISGQPDHCSSGQKLIIRVMVHSEYMNPGPAPAPAHLPVEPSGGGGGGGGGGSGYSPSEAPSSNGASEVAAVLGSSVLVSGLTGFVMMFV